MELLVAFAAIFGITLLIGRVLTKRCNQREAELRREQLLAGAVRSMRIAHAREATGTTRMAAAHSEQAVSTSASA